MKNNSFIYNLILFPEGYSKFRLDACCPNCKIPANSKMNAKAPSKQSPINSRPSNVARPTSNVPIPNSTQPSRLDTIKLSQPSNNPTTNQNTTLPAKSEQNLIMNNPTNLGEMISQEVVVNDQQPTLNSLPQNQSEGQTQAVSKQTQQTQPAQSSIKANSQQASTPQSAQSSSQLSNGSLSSSNATNSTQISNGAQTNSASSTLSAASNNSPASTMQNNSTQLNTVSNQVKDVISQFNSNQTDASKNVASKSSQSSTNVSNMASKQMAQSASSIAQTMTPTVSAKLAVDNPMQFAQALVQLPSHQASQQMNHIVPPMVPSSTFNSVVQNIPTGKLADILLQMQQLKPENAAKMADVLGNSELAAFVASLENELVSPFEKKRRLLMKIKEIQEKEQELLNQQNVERAQDFIEENFGHALATWKRQSDKLASSR